MASSQPNQDEQAWERRLAKRTDTVNMMKELEVYRLMTSVSEAHPDAVGEVPRTPDPRDRSLSKRQWEDKVFKWKKDMYTYCEDHGYQVHRPAPRDVDAE